jgi:hypothetical protein
VARGGGEATPGEGPPGDPEKNICDFWLFLFGDYFAVLYGRICYSVGMNDKINLELHAIGENLEQYHRIATNDMRFWGTVKPDHSPEDLVTKTILWLHDRLESGKTSPAVDANHAQARFTLYVKGKCRDLRKKKYPATSREVEMLASTVDEQTFDQTIGMLEQAKGKLKANDSKRLTRILAGENAADIMPKQTLQMFRSRVRDVYNAL